MKSNLNKGITLISLVVTVIIIIILSIISIKIITYDDTIQNAEKMTRDYNEAELATKIQLAFKDLQSEQLVNLNFDEVEFLTNRLTKYGISGAQVGKSDTTGWKVIYNGKVYPIDESGSIGEVTDVDK